MFSASRQPLIIVLLTLVAMLFSALYLRVDNLFVQESIVEQGTCLTQLICSLEQRAPLFSMIGAGVVLLFAALMVSRIGARHSLYKSGTLLPIPLYALVAVGLFVSRTPLCGALCGLLFVRAVRNFCSSFRDGYTFTYIFRASLYLSLMVVISPSTLPLLLLFPIALLNFKRTLRESLVAFAGLILPIFWVCYAEWAFGNDFLTPFNSIYEEFLSGEQLNLFTEASIVLIFELMVLLSATLCAIFYFLSGRYSMLMKSRAVLTFMVWAFILSISSLFIPGASTNIFIVVALPAALLMPYLFVIIRPIYANTLYVVMLVLFAVRLCTL